MNIQKKVLNSALLILFLSGCDQKAKPITSIPTEQEKKQYEQGYIDTH